ncbi:hypothetical protein [Streptomyces sp. NPDC088775]|uniref:hypothetical protein n=1 Tax=Streptomyces sp. NPDC088775 TaxID=3365896 RepID=UPI0037FC8A87
MSKPLFSGLSLRDPETGELPEIEAPDFSFTTGLAADLKSSAETGKPLPKRAALTSPTTKPSFRAESRRLAHGADDAKETKRRTESAWHIMQPFSDGRELRGFAPLTRTDGAENLGTAPEHVQERKPAPRKTPEGMPRVRTDAGAPLRDGRTSAGAKVERVNKTGTRKRRAAGKARPRSSDKVVYSARVGMTAGRKITAEERAECAERSAERTAGILRTRVTRAEAAAKVSRAEAKRHLADAIGRERDAKARGDKTGADAAREDVKKFRKLSTYKRI